MNYEIRPIGFAFYELFYHGKRKLETRILDSFPKIFPTKFDNIGYLPFVLDA